MTILYKQQHFLKFYNFINFTRLQMLNLSLHIGHKKVQWSKYLSLYTIAFRKGVVLLNLDYAILFINRAFFFLERVLYFYGKIFAISNFVNVGFGGLSQYFLNRRLVGHYDGYYLGGLVSNFFRIRTVKRRYKFEFVKSFRKFKGFLPTVFFIFDAYEHYLCYKESSFIGTPSIGFIDSDLDAKNALYPIISNDESLVANIYILMIMSFYIKLNRYKRRLKFYRFVLRLVLVLFKYKIYIHLITIGGFLRFQKLFKKRYAQIYGQVDPKFVHIEDILKTLYVKHQILYKEAEIGGTIIYIYKKSISFFLWFLKAVKYKRYRRWLAFYYMHNLTYESDNYLYSDFSTAMIAKFSKIKRKNMSIKRLFRPVYYYRYQLFLRISSRKFAEELFLKRVTKLGYRKKTGKVWIAGEMFFNAYRYYLFGWFFFSYRRRIFNARKGLFYRRRRRMLWGIGSWGFVSKKNRRFKKPLLFRFKRKKYWAFKNKYFLFFMALYPWFVQFRKFLPRIRRRLLKMKEQRSKFNKNFRFNRFHKKNKFNKYKKYNKFNKFDRFNMKKRYKLM